MSTLLQLVKISTVMVFSTLAFASENDKRPEHFKGREPGSVQEAQQILADYHQQLAKLVAKPSLAPADLGEIHIMTYTLENQLAYLIKDLTQVAQTLEKLHLLSESTDTDSARQQGLVYLNSARAYEK